MEIREQQKGAVLVVKPNGPLCAQDAEQFRDRMAHLAGEVHGRLVLDASAVSHIDSTGLEALVDLHEEMSATGHAAKLCAVGATLREVLQLTGLAGLFEYFEEAESAVRSFL